MKALRAGRYLALAVLFLAHCLVQGRYEDQAGKFDWHKQMIGRPLFVHFSEAAAAQQSTSTTVYVATKSGVVAALNANRGDLQWRIAAENGARIVSMLEVKDQVAALIELDGKYILRSFHTVSTSNSGLLNWETLLNVSAQCERCMERAFLIRVNGNSLSTTRTVTNSQLLIGVALDAYLFILRARDGEVLARTEINVGNADKQQPVNIEWLDALPGLEDAESKSNKYDSVRVLASVSSGQQRRQVGIVDVAVADDPASFVKRPVFQLLVDSNRIRPETCALISSSRNAIACASRESDSNLIVFANNDQQGVTLKVDLEGSRASRIRTIKRVLPDASCKASTAQGEMLIVNDVLVRIDLQSRCVETLARGILAHRLLTSACDADALRVATLSAVSSSTGNDVAFRVLKFADADSAAEAKSDETSKCQGAAVEEVVDARMRIPAGYPVADMDLFSERDHGWMNVRISDTGAFSAAHCMLVLADESVHFFTVSSKSISASASSSSPTAKHAWTREESLARIELAEFIELPVSVTFDNHADEAESEDELAADEAASRHFLEIFRRSGVAFRRRIQAQLGQLRDMFTVAQEYITDPERAFPLLGALLRLDFATLNRIVQNSGDVFAAQTGNVVSESPADLERTVQLKTDYFNLNKILVVVTMSGKLFGLESATGRIAWRVFASGWRERRKDALFSLHTAVDEPRRCALLGSDTVVETDSDDAAGRQALVHVLAFDPVRGNIITDETLGDAQSTRYTLIDVDLAAFHDEDDTHEHDAADANVDAYAFRKPLLLFDTVSERATLFGATRAAARAFVRFVRRRSLNFYTIDRERAAFSGYRLFVEPNAVASPVQADGKGQADWNVALHVNRTWAIVFGPKQQLLTVATRIPHEPMHSIGRPLGDRNVLYKYVNPNLIAVALQASYVQDDQARTLVSLHLIDTVSGQFIHQAQHKRASGPVHITVSENWLLYTFMNRKKYARQELVSVEFFEGSRRANATAFSTFQSRPIHASTQSYYLHMPIEAMRVTWTKAGITTKSVLLSLANGALLEMPKALFDSRRTMNYTIDLQEEGVLQYLPELPVVPQAVLTYGRALRGVRHIATAPTGLESTCLVLAYGGPDVFFDRVTPSRMYDVLKEDFEYALIATVTIGLLAGAFVLRQIAFRRALHKAWYS